MNKLFFEIYNNNMIKITICMFTRIMQKKTYLKKKLLVVINFLFVLFSFIFHSMENRKIVKYIK